MTMLVVQPASPLGQSLSSGPTDLFNLTLAQRALDGRDVSPICPSATGSIEIPQHGASQLDTSQKTASPSSQITWDDFMPPIDQFSLTLLELCTPSCLNDVQSHRIITGADIEADRSDENDYRRKIVETTHRVSVQAHSHTG